MNTIDRIKKLSGISGITESAGEKKYADRDKAGLLAVKKELQAVMAHAARASFKYKNAAEELKVVEDCLKKLDDTEKKEVTESEQLLSNLNGETILDEQEGMRFDPQATEEHARRIADAIRSQFNVKVDMQRHPTGAVIIKVNDGHFAKESEGSNPHVLTVQNLSKLIDKDYYGFRERGWHFDQPQGGRFGIGVPPQKTREGVEDSDNILEGKDDLWVLKVGEPDSDKMGIQFSGTRKECVDEWNDTKHSWPKGSKHKIERHVEESATTPVVEAEKEKLDYLNAPVENSGIKFEQGTKIRLPSAVKTAVKTRISELNRAILQYDDKGYNDKSIKQQTVDCLNQILQDLSSNDLEGVKKAQVYITTLMSPLTDFFPPQLINWLATANNPYVGNAESA